MTKKRHEYESKEYLIANFDQVAAWADENFGPHVPSSALGRPRKVVSDARKVGTTPELQERHSPVKPDESENWFETDLYKEIKSRMHGGSYLRVDLFKAGSSQKALAEATGIPRLHISQMIAGKRPISHENAQKLGKFFKRPAKRYRVMTEVA